MEISQLQCSPENLVQTQIISVFIYKLVFCRTLIKQKVLQAKVNYKGRNNTIPTLLYKLI